MNEINSKIQLCAQQLAETLQMPIDLPTPNETNQPIRIAVIGHPAQNLFGVLGEWIAELEPMNVMILRGYHCIIRYGDAQEYAIFKGGDRIAVSVDVLLAKLGEFAAIAETLEFEMTLPNPILKNLTLEVFASAEEFEDVNWSQMFGNAHYFLFTLSSTALLSMVERKVLRQRLLPNADACLGILLTQDNLVPDEARESIDASLHGCIKGAAQVYRLPKTDADAIRDLLEKLPWRRAELDQKRLRRAGVIQLRELLEAAQTKMEILSCDTEQLDEAIHVMSAKAKLLPGRQESACRRARMQYIARLKLEMNEMVTGFHQQLVEKLTDEIEESEVVDDLSEVLPRYVSDQWNLLMENIKNHIETILAEMSDGLTAYIEKDFREFIQEGMSTKFSEYLFCLVETYSPRVTDESMFYYQQPDDKSKVKTYGAIASGVALVLMSHPIIGAAVAVFGSKYFYKEGAKQSIANAKRALIAAVEDMSRRACDEAEDMLTRTFAAVEARLEENIEEAYQKMMDIM